MDSRKRLLAEAASLDASIHPNESNGHLIPKLAQVEWGKANKASRTRTLRERSLPACSAGRTERPGSWKIDFGDNGQDRKKPLF